MKKKSAKSVKSDKTEIDRRVAKIYELLVLGVSHADICRYVSENTDWNVDVRTVERYIASARKKLTALSEYHKAEELGRAIARLHKLYQSMIKVNDYKGAVAVQRETNLLLGLYAPPAKQSLELSGSVGFTLSFPDTDNDEQD